MFQKKRKQRFERWVIMSKIHFHQFTQLFYILFNLKRKEEPFYVLGAIDLPNKAIIYNRLDCFALLKLFPERYYHFIYFVNKLKCEFICAVLQPNIHKAFFLRGAYLLNLNSIKMNRCFEIFVSLKQLMKPRKNNSITKNSVDLFKWLILSKIGKLAKIFLDGCHIFFVLL